MASLAIRRHSQEDEALRSTVIQQVVSLPRVEHVYD